MEQILTCKKMRGITGIILAVFLLTACSKNTSFVNNPNAPEHLHNRPVGASSKDILTSATYRSLVVEIQYMQGYAPDAAAISHLVSMISSVSNKPMGVTFMTKEIPPSTSPSLSVNDVIEIERLNRTQFTTGDKIALYILYTNGTYTSGNVLGIAYKNTSTAVFGKTIQDNSGGLTQPSRTKLEATAMEHEIGHLMGLVDLGAAMQTNHKDAAHGNHCTNNTCLMHYTAETTDILGFLLTGNIPEFDANCKDDLRANGGQ
jgi:hypothetical protein